MNWVNKAKHRTMRRVAYRCSLHGPFLQGTHLQRYGRGAARAHNAKVWSIFGHTPMTFISGKDDHPTPTLSPPHPRLFIDACCVGFVPAILRAQEENNDFRQNLCPYSCAREDCPLSLLHWATVSTKYAPSKYNATKEQPLPSLMTYATHSNVSWTVVSD